MLVKSMRMSRMKSVNEESLLSIELTILTICRSDVDFLVERTSLRALLLVRNLCGNWTNSLQSNFKPKALRSSFLYSLSVRMIAYTCDVDSHS